MQLILRFMKFSGEQEIYEFSEQLAFADVAYNPSYNSFRKNKSKSRATQFREFF